MYSAALITPDRLDALVQCLWIHFDREGHVVRRPLRLTLPSPILGPCRFPLFGWH
jgi:hypothetical protein